MTDKDEAVTRIAEIQLRRPREGRLEDCTPEEFRAFALEVAANVEHLSDARSWFTGILADAAVRLLAQHAAQGVYLQRLHDVGMPEDLTEAIAWITRLIEKGARVNTLQAQHAADQREIADTKAELVHLRDTRNAAPSSDYLLTCVTVDRDALQARVTALTEALKEAVRLYECYGLTATVREGAENPLECGAWINAARAALALTTNRVTKGD